MEPSATLINGAAKYVATSAPLDREWANATVVGGDLVEFVRDLKDRPGGDIGVHASLSIAQALLTAQLGDELRLVIAPRSSAPDETYSTACHRLGLNQFEARRHPPAICWSTIA
jgi:dihydrofolate reductase